MVISNMGYLDVALCVRQAKVSIEGALIGRADNDYRNWKFYHMHRKVSFFFR